jgi:ribose transport system substrate-binding protein
MRRLSQPARAWWALAALPLGLLLASCSTEPDQSSGSGGSTPSAPTAPSASANAPEAGSSGGSEAASLFEAPRKADGDVTIQIITNGVSPFWDPMVIGMKKTSGELAGCKADWAAPTPPEVGQQKQQVENALAKGVDGIALSCIDGDACRSIIDSVIEKKIPIVTFDSDSSNSKRLAYIGTNNFNAGKAAGEAAVKLLPNGGKFVGFVGNISAENARERRDGFVEATKGHNIELLEVIEDNKDPARARKNVEDAITKYGDKVQGFLGLFSYNGPAIVQALGAQKGLREKYKVVVFDAEPVTLQELGKRNIDATVVQKPYDFGVLSTKLLYEINRKGWSAAKKELNIPDNGLYDTGVEVITPDTVKAYQEGLTKLGIKSS